MPNCIPQGSQWLQNLLRPLADETVGVAVGRREAEDTHHLPSLVVESVDPHRVGNPSNGIPNQPVVSHQCDAYRAGLLADIGYFREDVPTPGEAIDVSLRVADAGYSIVRTDEAVATWIAPADRRGLKDVMRLALKYGRADTLLDKAYDLRWLNSGVFAAALLSLLLPGLGLVNLSIGWIVAFLIFLWGWILSVRAPLIGWEMPLAPIHMAVYLLIVVAARDDWWPGLLGKSMHPAFIRQWCWLCAVLGSSVVLMFGFSLQGMLRVIRRHHGVWRATQVLVLGAAWRLLAGVGYLEGMVAGPRSEG
jgi:hypothetical protein